MPVLFAVMFTLVMVALDVTGDVVIKSAADKGRLFSYAIGFGILLYATNAIFWYFMMRNIGLGQGTVLYSMLALVITVGIGAIWFGEAFGTRQYLGMGFALAAVVLMTDTV
ncbi:MAG: EamA family transporter [Pseudomonadota bacterium]